MQRVTGLPETTRYDRTISGLHHSRASQRSTTRAVLLLLVPFLGACGVIPHTIRATDGTVVGAAGEYAPDLTENAAMTSAVKDLKCDRASLHPIALGVSCASGAGFLFHSATGTPYSSCLQLAVLDGCGQRAVYGVFVEAGQTVLLSRSPIEDVRPAR